LLIADHVTTATERQILGMAADRARRFALIAGQTNLNAESVDQLFDDVRRLARAYPQQPLPEILGDLVGTQDLIFTLLEGRQPPAQARQLYLLAGVVGGLLAKASHDLAEPHAALTQARTAFVCAETADHDGLRAWIRGLQALIAYWAGRPTESIRYAQSGTEYATRAGNTASVWLPASEARAWASLGNAAEALAAIERGEQAWDRVRPDELDELGGTCTFGRSRQLYYAADALAWLPSQGQAAQRYSLQAVEAYEDTDSPEWAFGDQAGAHADLAVARIAIGQLEGAVEAVSPVLELPPQQRINGIVASVKRVADSAARSPLADASRGLQEEIEAFTRTP
jgi:tetratricopeptide (TPR) repeat protein